MKVSKGLDKAQLENLDHPGQVFKCQFNPHELVVSRKNTWNTGKASGASLPAVTFGGTGARTLSLTLTFDTYDEGGQRDVSQVTNKVLALMDAKVGEKVGKKVQSRPPHVRFRFGHYESFPCVIADCNQTFTLFLPNGTPVRATLKLTLQEVPHVTPKNKKKGQNPTSHATGARRVRVVQAGDTLDLIADEELGDPAAWRQIADFNNLDDPRRLRPGQALLIPPEAVTAGSR